MRRTPGRRVGDLIAGRVDHRQQGRGGVAISISACQAWAVLQAMTRNSAPASPAAGHGRQGRAGRGPLARHRGVAVEDARIAVDEQAQRSCSSSAGPAA